MCGGKYVEYILLDKSHLCECEVGPLLLGLERQILEQTLAEPGDVFMAKPNTPLRTMLWQERSCVKSIVLVYTNSGTVQGIMSTGLLVIPDRFSQGKVQSWTLPILCRIDPLYSLCSKFESSSSSFRTFISSLILSISFMWGIVGKNVAFFGFWKN